jgi:hypothetical protein
MVQLVNHDPGFFQGLFARRSDPVYPSSPPGQVPQLRLQQTASFHSVKEGIERARPNAIAMMLKLFYHGKAKDRLMRSVNEHMDANESTKELSLPGWHVQRIPSCSRSTSYYRKSMI